MSFRVEFYPRGRRAAGAGSLGPGGALGSRVRSPYSCADANPLSIIPAVWPTRHYPSGASEMDRFLLAGLNLHPRGAGGRRWAHTRPAPRPHTRRDHQGRGPGTSGAATPAAPRGFSPKAPKPIRRLIWGVRSPAPAPTRTPPASSKEALPPTTPHLLDKIAAAHSAPGGRSRGADAAASGPQPRPRRARGPLAVVPAAT